MSDSQLPPLSVPYEERVATEIASADWIAWKPYETWDKGLATETASADGFVREQRENLVVRWVKNVSLLGSLAQWVSAAAALVTMGVAIYGVDAALPLFQSRLLAERNAKLEFDRWALVLESSCLSYRKSLEEDIQVWREAIRTAANSLMAKKDVDEVQAEVAQIIGKAAADITGKLSASDRERFEPILRRGTKAVATRVTRFASEFLKDPNNVSGLQRGAPATFVSAHSIGEWDKACKKEILKYLDS